jgi:hypothetical protein
VVSDEKAVNNQVLHVKQAAEDFQPGKEEKLRRA